ncbi:MAG: DUF86 domain-containing protein [Desulfobacterales bacterium]|jgi:uncharacterized protein with HEPN domain
MSRRLWKYRITDIIDSIKKIQNYADQMEFDDFQKDEKTIDAVIRNFIVIGEAARHVPHDISTKYPNIPWQVMGDMRNFAVHEYWGAELSTIWKTIRGGLPPLVPSLNQVIDSEKDQEG